jgi:hypothetical protein
MSARVFWAIAGVVGAAIALIVSLPSEPPEIAAWRAKRAALPSDASACRALGGTWTSFGNMYEFCRVMTSDSGKACKSSADCQGVCLARSTERNSGTFDSCSKEILLHGCYEARESDHVSTVCQD